MITIHNSATDILVRTFCRRRIKWCNQQITTFLFRVATIHHHPEKHGSCSRGQRWEKLHKIVQRCVSMLLSRARNRDRRWLKVGKCLAFLLETASGSNNNCNTHSSSCSHTPCRTYKAREKEMSYCGYAALPCCCSYSRQINAFGHLLSLTTNQQCKGIIPLFYCVISNIVEDSWAQKLAKW